MSVIQYQDIWDNPEPAELTAQDRLGYIWTRLEDGTWSTDGKDGAEWEWALRHYGPMHTGSDMDMAAAQAV